MIKGTKHTEEYKKRLSQIMKNIPLWNRGTKGLVKPNKGNFAKGHKPWNTGTKGSVKPNSGNFKPGEHTGEEHWLWKGDLVGYDGLHKWVGRKLGKPDTCEKCGTSGLEGKKIHWANKSQEYKRDVTDWLRLCASCHKLYDKGKIEVLC